MAHRATAARGTVFASILILVTVCLAGGPVTPALAVDPNERLADPALEERAREVSKDLRCVVCQNQSIDDSDAELARDMRVLVRERIQQGDSNEEVVNYVVSRYGDFVLLKPPFKVETLALWLGPVAIVLLGLVGAWFFYRGQRAKTTAPPLSPEDEARVDSWLKDNTR